MYSNQIAKLFQKNQNDFKKLIGKKEPMTLSEAEKKFSKNYFLKTYPKLKDELLKKDPFENRTIVEVLSDDRILWAVQDKNWIKAYN
jgi:hypothetical protein